MKFIIKRKKKLITCPVCEAKGIKSVLGELKDGYVIISRFHHTEVGNFDSGFKKKLLVWNTYITGESFAVSCGLCGTKVYIKSQLKINQNNERKTINGTTEGV